MIRCSLISEHQPFYQTALWLVVGVGPGVIFGAQLGLWHFDAPNQIIRCQQRIGDDFGVWQHELRGVGIIIAAQLIGGWGAQRLGQIFCTQERPSEAALLGHVVHQRFGVDGGHFNAAQDRTLQQRACSLFAQGQFKFSLADPALLQRKAIAFAVKLAVHTLERRDLQYLFTQRLIPDGQAQLGVFVIECTVAHQPLQHCAVKADLLGLSKRQLPARLLFDGADFVLQLACIGIHWQRHVTHAADGADVAAEVHRPKACQPQDKKAHQDPHR